MDANTASTLVSRALCGCNCQPLATPTPTTNKMGSKARSQGCTAVQGGGLIIDGGIVTLDLCEIYDNEAGYVSNPKSKHFSWRPFATLLCLKSQRPNGKPLVANMVSVLFVRRK